MTGEEVMDAPARQPSKTPSRFDVSELAIKSAIELARLRSGEEFDGQAMAQLADALTRTSNPGSAQGPFRFFEVGYHKPFMRLFKDQHTSDPRSIKEVQEYLAQMAGRLERFLKDRRNENADELASFCVDLHHELSSTLMSESRVAKRQTRSRHSQVASSFC